MKESSNSSEAAMTPGYQEEEEAEMARNVTEAMIDGWAWNKNTLCSPNGRFHVVCTRNSYENRDGSRRTLWSADAFAVGRNRIDGWDHAPREYGGRVGGSSNQPARREAAIAALDVSFRANESDRLPSDEDVAGLHPDFARRLREARAAHAAIQADQADHAAQERWEALQKQLADLPRQIEEVEASLPALRLAADRAKILRALAYEDREEAEGIVLGAIFVGMEAERQADEDAPETARWVGWAAGWRDGTDRSLGVAKAALAALDGDRRFQATHILKMVHAAELAIAFAKAKKE